MQETMIDYKQNIYQELSRLTKGLGSEKRLDILNILSQGPKTVEGIAHATGLSVANTSRHLQVLKESHLVVTSRNGNFIRYSLASEKVVQLVLLLFAVGEEQLAEVRAIESDYVEEYEAGHLPKALNLPIDEFDQKKAQLPKEKTIIVYCRGRQCGYANLAAQDLQSLGYSIYSLNRSFADWKWGAPSRSELD